MQLLSFPCTLSEFHLRISFNNSAKIYFSHPGSLVKLRESVAYLLITQRGNIQVVLSPLAICCKRGRGSRLLERSAIHLQFERSAIHSLDVQWQPMELEKLLTINTLYQ